MNDAQLLLDLSSQHRMGRADFLPAAANQAGLDAVDAWRDWPMRRMLICGPVGSGRSHLLQIWAAQSGAYCLRGDRLRSLPDLPEAAAYAVDDAELCATSAALQEALFHLFNHCQDRAIPLLLTARDTPGTWGLTLPDLESRLQTCAITRLERPDDDLLRMVLVKLIVDRQLAVGEETLCYLIKRIDRSLDTARQVVDALDHVAVTRQKRVSRALAAEILSSLPQRARIPTPKNEASSPR